MSPLGESSTQTLDMPKGQSYKFLKSGKGLTKRPYRSYFEIIFNILRNATDGKIISVIARESNLSHYPAKNYVQWLQANGLVKVRREPLNKTKSYAVISTTTAGIEFIQTFEKLCSMLQNTEPQSLNRFNWQKMQF